MERNRKRIDQINKEISDLLEERFILTKKIGDYKNENNLHIENLKRENEILNNIDGIYSAYKINIFEKIFFLSKNQQNEKKSIILIGMPLCGKTSIGKLLAKELKLFFLDTDEYIENKYNMSVKEIFEKYGEVFFREEEEKLCEIFPNGFVIATGGGIILNPKNQEKLKKHTIIYLKRDFENIKEEIEKRPLLINKSFEELYKERYLIYEKLADYIINNNGSFDNTLNLILQKLNN